MNDLLLKQILQTTRTIASVGLSSNPAKESYEIVEYLKGRKYHIIPVNPTGSKTARMNAVSPDWEAGNVLIPHPHVHPWVHDFIEELVNFPSAKHDDQCDAMTQALIRFRGTASGEFGKEKPSKPHAPSLRGDDQW